MFILPEETLTKLICSVCSKYLSVKPVKVYRSRIVKCGRCSSDNDDGVVSLLNSIITNGLFPCINRYEGCNQLMNYSEVAVHEKNCVSRTYKCPICSSKNEHTSYQFFQHYKNVHPNKILENPRIITNGEKEFENYYLYQENSFIFIINLRCDTLQNCFLFNVACLGPRERVENILQYVKCYLNDDGRLFFQTKELPCVIFEDKTDSFKITLSNKRNLVILNFCLNKSNVDNFNYIEINKSSVKTNNSKKLGLYNKYPKIHLSDNYKKMFPNHYLSPSGTKIVDFHAKDIFPRNCDFCENIFQISGCSKMFRCICDHFYCSTCYDISPYCHKDKELQFFITTFEIYFYCRWNCGNFYSGPDLIDHEDKCNKNSDAGYTLTRLAEKHFIFYFSAENHLVSRSNVFSFKNYNFYDKREQKVFVITRDNFKFVLNLSYNEGTLHFSVSHDNPTDKYNILFKVKCEKGETCHINELIINTKQGSKARNFSGNFNKRYKVLGFVVLLK